MSISSGFAKELSATLVRLGISQREAAKRSHISPGYLSNMCLGKVPSLGKLLQFCRSLDIDPASLLAVAGYDFDIAQGEPAALPRSEASVPNDRPGGDWRQACRTEDCPPIPQAYAHVTDFCLRIAGWSMWPHLQDGDVVGVRAQDFAEPGQVIAARLGAHVTVAQYTCTHGAWALTPFNPDFPPLPIDPHSPDFAILGVVAWHTHDWLAPQRG